MYDDGKSKLPGLGCCRTQFKLGPKSTGRKRKKIKTTDTELKGMGKDQLSLACDAMRTTSLNNNNAAAAAACYPGD